MTHGAMVQTIETTTGRGVPDLAVIHGRTYWIEVKACDGSCFLRPEQYVWQRKAREHGVDVMTVQLRPTIGMVHIYTCWTAIGTNKRWKLTHLVHSNPLNEFLQLDIHRLL